MLNHQGTVSDRQISISKTENEESSIYDKSISEAQFGIHQPEPEKFTGTWPRAEPALKEAVDAQIQGVDQKLTAIVDGIKNEFNAKLEDCQRNTEQLGQRVAKLQGWSFKNGLLQCFLLIIAGGVVALITLWLSNSLGKGP